MSNDNLIILKGWIFVMLKCLILASLILMIFSIQAKTQTLTVQGKVTSSRIPIKQALVTFIDEADTTNKYSAITDISGQVLRPQSAIQSNNSNRSARDQGCP